MLLETTSPDLAGHTNEIEEFYKSKAAMYTTPGNPSGAIYSKKELREIAAVVEKYHQVYAVSNEVYEHISFATIGHFSIGSIAEIKKRVITLGTVSKGFALTGCSIGFIAAEKWIAEGVEKLQG